MNRTKALSAIAVVLVVIIIGVTFSLLTRKDPQLQEAKNADLHGAMVDFSETAYSKAQKRTESFLIAFQNQNCPRCIRQKQVLEGLLLDPEFSKLKIFVIDAKYSNNYDRFVVKFHDTLIFYKGFREVSRSNGLVEFNAIKQQLQG